MEVLLVLSDAIIAVSAATFVLLWAVKTFGRQ